MALLALVLQIGLAFGHVHAVHAAQNVAAASAAGTSSPLSGDPDDEYCATCAILALLTGAQTANPPAVAPAVMRGLVEITIVTQAVHFDSSRAAFRSRAPPLS